MFLLCVLAWVPCLLWVLAVTPCCLPGVLVFSPCSPGPCCWWNLLVAGRPCFRSLLLAGFLACWEIWVYVLSYSSGALNIYVYIFVCVCVCVCVCVVCVCECVCMCVTTTLRWHEARAVAALDFLVNEGMAWVDAHNGKAWPDIWFLSLFPVASAS